MMRVSLLQLDSGPDRTANLARIEDGLAEAAARGSDLVLLPEACNYRGPLRGDMVEDDEGPTVGLIRRFAVSAGMRVVIGGMWAAGADPRHPANCCLLVGRDGKIAAAYRKVHLFRLHADGQRDQDEGGYTTAGDELVTADCGEFTLGLSICYDLRFPELYRALTAAGATLLCVPANFTLHTGRDHWETLLRARAIENLAYVAAPAQTGTDPEGTPAYGHSLIVDPWGTVICCAPDEVTVVTADLDPGRVRRCRRALRALDDVRPDVYAREVRRESADG
jgi:deaminated glutathione amidase